MIAHILFHVEHLGNRTTQVSQEYISLSNGILFHVEHLFAHFVEVFAVFHVKHLAKLPADAVQTARTACKQLFCVVKP